MTQHTRCARYGVCARTVVGGGSERNGRCGANLHAQHPRMCPRVSVCSETEEKMQGDNDVVQLSMAAAIALYAAQLERGRTDGVPELFPL